MGSKGGKVAQGLLLEGREEGPLAPDVSGQQLRGSDVQVRRWCESLTDLLTVIESKLHTLQQQPACPPEKGGEREGAGALGGGERGGEGRGGGGEEGGERRLCWQATPVKCVCWLAVQLCSGCIHTGMAE